MKKTALLITPLIFLLSCSLERDDPAVIITDPAEYLTLWKEVVRKVGATDWEIISSGDTLALASPFIESHRPRSGYYTYKPENLQIDISAFGSFEQEKDLLSFFSNAQTNIVDRTTVKYEINGDTLIIYNSLIVPNIEVKYKKVEFKEY